MLKQWSYEAENDTLPDDENDLLPDDGDTDLPNFSQVCFFIVIFCIFYLK